MAEVSLAIVVPCYNEEKNIPLILQRFNEVIGQQRIEVIIVDNGSTDGSAKVIAELVPQYSFARSVHVEINQGYGFGILCGLKAAQGEYLGWTHADMQTDPSDIVKALLLVEQNGEHKNLFIKGSRVRRKFFDNVFTVAMSLFESIYLRTGLWEINAQPTIFHRDFFQTWVNPPVDFALDLYAYCHAKKSGLTILRFPVKFPDRVHGVSSWNTDFKQKLKFIKRTLEYSRKLKQSLSMKGL